MPPKLTLMFLYLDPMIHKTGTIPESLLGYLFLQVQGQKRSSYTKQLMIQKRSYRQNFMLMARYRYFIP